MVISKMKGAKFFRYQNSDSIQYNDIGIPLILIYGYFVRLFIFEFHIISSNKTEQVSWQEFAFREDCHVPLLLLHKLKHYILVNSSDLSHEGVQVEWLFCCCLLIRKYLFPIRWRHCIQSHLGFEIRLVKKRKNAVCVIGFELGIQVLLLIYIDKANASTPIVVVFVPVHNGNLIFTNFKLCHIKENEPLLQFCFGGLLVDNHFGDVLGLKIND